MRRAALVLIVMILAGPLFADDVYSEESIYQLYRASMYERYAAYVIATAVNAYISGQMDAETAYDALYNLWETMVAESEASGEFVQNAATALGLSVVDFQDRMTRELEEAARDN